MIKKIIILCFLFIGFTKVKAQYYEPFVHEGEFGVGVGAGHYFGDLTAGMKWFALRPKFTGGIFFRKQFNNYVGLKVAANYAFLGYSDKNFNYWKNYAQKVRNLSFNTNVWEISFSGDFNFFRFQPGFPEFRFTPYVSLGVGVFAYDPYTFFEGKKYNLRSIGTEGQQDKIHYPNLKPYNTMAVCVPVGFGMKYNLNPKLNIFAEATYRFTTTDYLDDVSGNYAPDAFAPDANGNPSIGYLLQDRSYEYGQTFGIKGRQRGNSKQPDSYVTIIGGISFNLGSYRCPKY